MARLIKTSFGWATLGFSASDLAEGALIGLIFFCPLALGSVHLWAIAGTLGLATLAAVAVSVRGLPRPSRLELLFVAVAAFIGLQRLPLPGPLLHLLSPNTADLYAFSLAGLPGAQGFHPLSLDPPSTSRELAKAIAYALVFLSAGAIAASRRRRRRLAAAIGLAGFAVAAIGFGHRLFDATELFGLPLYRAATSSFLTTFGNRNNAAGFFCLTAPILLAVGLRGSRRGWLFWGPAYLLTSVAVFLTLSRGGMAAFFAGQLAVILLLWRRNTQTASPRLPARRPFPIAAIAGATLALAVVAYLSAGAVLDRLGSLANAATGTPEGKLIGFRQSLPLLRDFPVTGIGRGAFPTVSGHYLTFDNQTAEYVENEALQLPIDLGLPVGLLLLGMLGLTLARALRHPGESTVAAGLSAGLFALALQNLADFSLELGGIAVPAAVALAVLLRDGQERSAGESRARLPQWLSRSALACGALAGTFALLDARHDWRDEPDAFAERAPQLSAAAAAAAATPLIERHPASFVLPFAVSERYLAEHVPGQALLWVNKAMYLKPNLAASHALAAEALGQLHRKAQALLEARLFAENGGGGNVLPAMAARYPALDDLVQAVPDTADGLLDLANFFLSRQRFGDARETGLRAVRLAPNDAAVRARNASVLLAAGSPSEAADEARASLALDPAAIGTYLVLAAAEEQRGQKDSGTAALAALGAGLHEHPGDVGLTLALVRLELRLNLAARALEHLKLLGPQSGSAQRAEVFAVSADVYLALGQVSNAEDAYRNAMRLRPGDGYELSVAKILEGQSHFAEAVRVLRELEAKLDPAQRAEVSAHIAADQKKAGALEALGRRELLLGPQSPVLP